MKRAYSDIRARSHRQSKWTYFENCVVCQGMKEADEKGMDLGEKELKELFGKVNESN